VSDQATIAVLGTGIMGAPMAGRLLDAGFTVRVWNRTASKTAPLVERGAIAADSPADVVRGADFVLTMLADGPTVHAVMSDALPAMTPDAIWLQAATVGLAHIEALAKLADDAGVTFLDAPVLGTKQPAETGQLVVMAAGPDDAIERSVPVFEAIGRKIIRLSGTGAASKLKLVVNGWVLGLTNAGAEAIGLSRALGVDPELFLETISGGAADSPYVRIKGRAMIDDEYPLSFPLDLAVKDARLIVEAAGDDVDAGAAVAALRHLERASELGYGGTDMAAIYRGVIKGDPS
jgi:3-hydroxyisobutyrate dehydrogenase